MACLHILEATALFKLLPEVDIIAIHAIANTILTV